jgi:hypothetical protein
MEKSLFAKRGFGAVAAEEERREKVREQMKDKLWRYSLTKKVTEGRIRFLTEDPICFWEHTYKNGDRYENKTCSVDGCPDCAGGNKPTYKAAWLIQDLIGNEYEDRKTGEKKSSKGRVCILVRGMRDASVLQKKSQNYGLTNRTYDLSRTGTGQNTTWQFERGDEDKLSPKQMDAIKSSLPEKLRDLDFYDIVEQQIKACISDEAGEDHDEDEEEKVEQKKAELKKGVEEPAKRPGKKIFRK